MRTSRCDACGGNAQPLPLEDGDALATLGSRGDASPLAREAWSRRDFASFVSHALGVEHVHGARPARLSDGSGFVAVVDGVAVLVAIRQSSQQLVLEAPVARLPATMTVPAMRTLLEVGDDPRPGARFSLRDDLVVARFVGRLDQDEPLAFGPALRGVVAAASQMAERLVATTDARMLAPSEHQALDFDTMPPGRFLGRVAHAAPAAAPPAPSPAHSRRPQAAPFRQAATSPSMSAAAGGPASNPLPTPSPSPVGIMGGKNPHRPTVSGAFEAMLAPGAPPPHLPPPRAPDPFSQAGESLELPIPPAAAPPITEASPAGGAHPAATATPVAVEPPPRPAGSSAKTIEVAQNPALRPPPRAATGSRPTPAATPVVTASQVVEDRASVAPPSPHARGGDMTSTQVSAAPPPPGPKQLCDLLHKAQTLGAVLSFADQPASNLLLVRATVYRAVFEFSDSAPGAVAQLFDETLPLTREIHITAPGKRRGAMAIPEAESAFASYEKILAAGGVLPASGPPGIEPITTAQDAKQHLARYVSEIDQAPGDLELRHFLGLGALCELVVRTKLPPQTLDRVRGIIARAIKEGARQSSIDLMMTALNRIIGG